MIQFLILILLLGCGEHTDVCEIKKRGSSLASSQTVVVDQSLLPQVQELQSGTKGQEVRYVETIANLS